jgi:hypothetical protein
MSAVCSDHGTEFAQDSGGRCMTEWLAAKNAPAKPSAPGPATAWIAVDECGAFTDVRILRANLKLAPGDRAVRYLLDPEQP